jgi:signal transduction histidine kinase
MKPLLCILSILCFFCTNAQQKKIDSLLAVNNSYPKEDSQKVVYLTNIFRQYTRMGDMNKMEAYAARALAVAKKLPQAFSLAYVYLMKGRSYHGKAMYVQAINTYNNGIAVAKKSGDKNAMGVMYINLGSLYGTISDHAKSLEANQQAINLYNEIGNREQVSTAYMNTGVTYNEMQKPVKAVEYINKALVIFTADRKGLNYATSYAYQNLSKSYLIATNDELIKLGVKPAERYVQSLALLNRALKIAETAEEANALQIPVHTGIGEIFELTSNDTEALVHYEAALALVNNNSQPEDIGAIQYKLGNFYYNTGNYTKAKMYLQSSLNFAQTTGLPDVQKNALEKLSELFAKIKQFDSAFIYHTHYAAIKDSILNTEKETEITRKQLQIDFAVKENDYKLTQQVSAGKLKQQKLQIIFLALAIAFILVIAGLILYDRRKTKKLNEIITQQKTSLEQLGEVKDKLFSVVSHDMRAPVNSLISFIDILEDGNMPPQKLSLYAKELKQNLTYTAALMNNLLNWAASQMQGFKPVAEPFDISVLVTEVINSLQHHVQQKQISIQNNIDAGTMIHADRNMTASILRNLISNAVKFSYKEGVVEVTNQNTEAGYQVSVTDEGTGMDVAQTAAFNSNSQQQTESKRGTDNEKGTGLGLLLCKTFAQQMGGKISAVKNEKGMTFTIWLTAKG